MAMAVPAVKPKLNRLNETPATPLKLSEPRARWRRAIHGLGQRGFAASPASDEGVGLGCWS